MSLPFQEFPASQLTVDLGTGALSLTEAGELAASGTTLGEIVAASGEAAAIALAAEPALILGVGLGAVLLGDAVLKQFKPTEQLPQWNGKPGTGGRIGGNVFAEFKFTVKNAPEVVQNTTLATPVSNLNQRGAQNGLNEWFVATGTGIIVLLGAAPGIFEKEPTLTFSGFSGGQPGTDKQRPGIWTNPGTGVLPVPIPVDIALPGGETIPITPTVYPSPSRQPGVVPGTPIDPSITVYSPEVGVSVKFTPVSVSINFHFPSESPSTNAPIPNLDLPIKFPQNPCLCPPEDNSEVLCRIKALQDGLLFDGYDYTVRSLPARDSFTQDGVTDGVYYVELNVNPPSSGARIERGNDGAPNIYYQGWLSFIADGHQLPRQPVHYLQSGFFAPEGCTGFSYTITYGGTASVVYSSRKKKPYVNHC